MEAIYIPFPDDIAEKDFRLKEENTENDPSGLFLFHEGKNFVSRSFGDDGPISKSILGFEKRPQQVEMALSVWDVLCRPAHLLAEAGTGVGKSLAYLVPLCLWISSNRKRAVISTHTVNLQQQLYEKDIPIAARIFEGSSFNLTYEIFKGRSHYVCMRRFRNALDDIRGKLIPLEKDDQLIVDLDCKIENGLWDGDKEHLDFPVPESVWSMIASESDRCMGVNCKYKEVCFYQKKRKSLEKSHIIVVNHALFMAHTKLFRDTKGKTSLLPPFEVAIFDEAHHLEEQAKNSLSVEVSWARLKRLFDDTVRIASRGSLKRALTNEQTSRLKKALEDGLSRFGEILRRLDPKVHNELFMKDETTGEIDGRIAQAGVIGKDFIDFLADLPKTLSDWPEYDLSDEERFEVNALIRRFADLMGTLGDIDNLRGQGESFVYWVEKGHGKKDAQQVIKCSPLEIGSYLNEEIWNKTMRTICTSATLTTDNSFEYIKRMLSLENCGRVREEVFGSPFDFPNQAALCVPLDERGLHPNSSAFNAYVAEILPQIVAMAQGRTFVLFTARKSLEDVSAKCRDKIEEMGYPLLVQGEAPREALLRDFKSLGNAVLFGLDSFWEGVDVQGEALSCVVVVKIPFPVPTDPYAKAREDLWRKRGLDPFRHHSLPTATLKLKQGFGRLIRSRTDKGAVIILDARLLKSSYGKSILRSLPPAKFTTCIEEAMKMVPPFVKPPSN